MNRRYEYLLRPLPVGNVLLKNRMVSTAGTPHRTLPCGRRRDPAVRLRGRARSR